MAFTTILAQQNRGPVANQLTPAQSFVATRNAMVSFRMPMADADILDARNSVTFEFQLSDDNVSFRPWINQQTWQGGPDSLDKNSLPAGPNVQASVANPNPGTPKTWWVRIVYGI